MNFPLIGTEKDNGENMFMDKNNQEFGFESVKFERLRGPQRDGKSVSMERRRQGRLETRMEVFLLHMPWKSRGGERAGKEQRILFVFLKDSVTEKVDSCKASA